MIRRTHQRKGTTVVECAIVFPMLFLLVLGVLIGALGVFRYQEVASLAREASRWASVHGANYEFNSGKKAATASDVYDKVIRPKLVALDPKKLTYKVTWDPDNRQGSKVTVSIDYNWAPEAFLGSIKLSSTSTTLMSY